MNVLLQNERLPCSSQVLESLWVTSSSPTLHGSCSTVSLEDFRSKDSRDRPFIQPLIKEEKVDEDCDECFHQPEKKRRLTAEQVQYLERNFEVENRLEPERKVQLAKELGLQARQVAIWFQNRRARFKSKQLEKDYDSLKARFDSLRADHDNLLKEKEKLRTEVLLLKDKLHIREKENADSEPYNPISSSHAEPQKPIPSKGSVNASNTTTVVCKQEDASSAKSGVFDSDSPHCTDGNHSSMLDPADSSHAFEPDQSDFSQDEEDNLSRSLLPPPYVPKLEYYSSHDPAPNSCNFGFAVEDQSFCFWP